MKFNSIFLIFVLIFSSTANASRVIVTWTSQANAGKFFDPDPRSKYIEHNGQACIKEAAGVKNGRAVVKIRCRQPNGQFKYIW